MDNNKNKNNDNNKNIEQQGISIILVHLLIMVYMTLDMPITCIYICAYLYILYVISYNVYIDNIHI